MSADAAVEKIAGKIVKRSAKALNHFFIIVPQFLITLIFWRSFFLRRRVAQSVIFGKIGRKEYPGSKPGAAML